MPLPPSRRDITGPPPRNVSDLSKIVRHGVYAARRIEPGLTDGRFGTPKPLDAGGMEQLVDTSRSTEDAPDIAWEYDDTGRVTATGTQIVQLTHEPIKESLFVFWHPGDGLAARLPSTDFTLSGQTVTIPDPGYFAAGDTFTFQYQYEIGDDVPEPSQIGTTAPGVWDATAHTMTYAIPAGVVAGDFFILSVRGSVAPGGGELNDAISCTDPRMTLLFQATLTHGGQTVIESIWGGFATGSGTAVVVNVTDSTFPTAQARGVLAAYRGVNGTNGVSSTEPGTGGPTPVVNGIAAVAVVWLRGLGTTVNAVPPTGYTDSASSGADYYSTDISWWYDPDASTSPSGTFSGEGCCVIALT